MIRALLLLGVMAGSLAACVTATPPPEPVLQPTAQSVCTQVVSLAAPTDLSPVKPVAVLNKAVTINAAAPCLAGPSGAREGYVVFALPSKGKVASVSAGALIEARRLLAPSVFTVAADGRPLRTFKAEDLLHRGQSVSVLFAPRSEERFVVVAVDASMVGGAYPLTVLDPTSASSPSHKASINTNFAPAAAPYSYEGQAFVRVYFANPAG